MVDESARFENLDADFVGDEGCFDCHEDQYRGYERHGMAQSVYPLTPANVVEDFTGVIVHDTGRDYLYTVLARDGRFYQEEFRRGAGGTKTHSLVREMKYVVGSGSAARTYLTEINSRYYQLPLTWYTEEKRWDFSPGYDSYNARFGRQIPDRCITCHNSYPEPILHADGKYASMPNGIGCERCHGPGSVHVEARLASPDPAGDVDATIVNPAHLSLDRRLDVCQQCHLHTTVSVLRDGRSAYDYRPSQPLAGYVAMFSLDEARAADEIDVISHADRMKQSACFVATQAGDNPMDCLTCHNPHEGFRDAGPDYFNVTCRSCHNPADLTRRLDPEQPTVNHTATSNCFGCHMPKVRAEGTPHASFTDHWIRVVEEQPDMTAALESEPRPARGILEPYFERDVVGTEAGIYRGMAYVIFGRQNGDSTALTKGIDLLESNLAADDSMGEAYYLLGFAYLQLGRVAEAVPRLEKSISIDPNVPERLNTLAQAYESARRDPDAVERLYVKALSIQPAAADIRVNYGRFLESRGRLADAIQRYATAVAEQPWLETAHYNLGTAYLREGRFAEAEASLREAIHLDPDYVDALGNLGLLLASRGNDPDARTYFERAVGVAPNHPTSLGNLGAYYLNAGRPQDALALLGRAVAADPAYVDGWINLALATMRLGDIVAARQHAERALRLDPENEGAKRLLDAL